MNMFDMDKEMARFESRGRIIRTAIVFVTAIVFLGVCVLGYIMVKASRQIEEHGLKSVVIQIWKGPVNK
jgi:hypothetical protein